MDDGGIAWWQSTGQWEEEMRRLDQDRRYQEWASQLEQDAEYQRWLTRMERDNGTLRISE